MNAIRIAIAGEALIDLVAQPDGRMLSCLGGAAYNVARALALQGVATAYLNPFSADRLGRQLAARMLTDGVVLAQPEPIKAVTSLALVGVDEQGHPDYAFYRQGVADRAITAAALNAGCAALPALQVVCTGCLALDPQDADVYQPWLVAQRAAARLVVVDANVRPAVIQGLAPYRANILQALAQADVIKASDEDLAYLALPGGDALAQARHLFTCTPVQCMALTLGPEGACLLVRGRQGIAVFRAKEPKPVQVADTVGAGDCFLAGLLACLLHHAQALGQTPAGVLAQADTEVMRDVLAHALAHATLCVMRSGCTPSSWAQVRARAQLVPALTA
jgi:fructokinase